MTAYGAECFTMNEVNRLKILQDVIDGRLTTSLASQRLGLTDRHCRRLLARYRESGPLALANRRRGLRGSRMNWKPQEKGNAAVSPFLFIEKQQKVTFNNGKSG